MASQLVTLGGWRAGNEWPLFHSLFSFTFYVFSVSPPDLYWSEKYPNFMIVKKWLNSRSDVRMHYISHTPQYIWFSKLGTLLTTSSYNNLYIPLPHIIFHYHTILFPHHMILFPHHMSMLPPFLCARFCPSLTGGLVSFLMTCQAGWRNRAQVTDCRFSE